MIGEGRAAPGKAVATRSRESSGDGAAIGRLSSHWPDGRHLMSVASYSDARQRRLQLEDADPRVPCLGGLSWLSAAFCPEMTALASLKLAA
jgi:hypothetical protein